MERPHAGAEVVHRLRGIDVENIVGSNAPTNSSDVPSANASA